MKSILSILICWVVLSLAHKTTHHSSNKIQSKVTASMKASLKTLSKLQTLQKKLLKLSAMSRLQHHLKVMLKAKAKAKKHSSKFLLQKLKLENREKMMKVAKETKKNDDVTATKDKDLTDEQKKKKFEQELSKLSDKEKIAKYPNLFYWETLMDQNEAKEQKQMNEKAEELFSKDYNGNDQYKDIKEGDVFIIIENEGEENSKNLKSYHLMLNQENLYVQQEQTEGYRGIVDSMAISEIYDEKRDNVKMGECCEKIGIINQKLYGDQDNQTEMQCFLVEGKKSTWNICDTDIGVATDWRQAIILHVILHGLRLDGIYDLDGLVKFQKNACVKPRGWSYQYQSRWPCMCPEGSAQSPIDIPSKRAIQQKVPYLFWKYLDMSSVVAKVGDYETVITGEFGKMIARDSKRNRVTWKATEVRFKFRSEHTVDEKDYPCEMQVFHTNGEDRMAVSMFISDQLSDVSSHKAVAKFMEQAKINPGSEVYSSMGKSFFEKTNAMSSVHKAQKEGTDYINSFLINSWPDKQKSPYGSEKCIDIGTPALNLTTIMDDSVTFSNSFYSYMGSDTVPPCNEDVLWYVMKDPIIVSDQTLEALKKKTIGEGQRNNRDVMPLGKRQVFSHDECSSFKEDVPVDIADNTAQLLKAKSKVNYYAIAHNEVRTVFDEQNTDEIELNKSTDHKLTMKRINEKQMREEHANPRIVDELRYQLGEWLVENRHKIQEKNRLKQEMAQTQAN